MFCLLLRFALLLAAERALCAFDDVNVYEACYGTGHEDALKPSCSSGSFLYVSQVITYAKRLESGCEREAHFNRNASCCTYVNDYEDCGLLYTQSNDHNMVHYTNCTGRNSCNIRVAWQKTKTSCNQSEYLDETNYMRQFYRCIQNDPILSMCSNDSRKGNPLYIWNDGYPGSMCLTGSGCYCKVKAKGTSKIVINLLDIRFQTQSSSCGQSLIVSENGSSTELTCADNNLFTLTNWYNSSTDEIDIRLVNTVTSAGGQFWIQILATNYSDSIEMQCGLDTNMTSCIGPSSSNDSTSTVSTSAPSSLENGTNSTSSDAQQTTQTSFTSDPSVDNTDVSTVTSSNDLVPDYSGSSSSTSVTTDRINTISVTTQDQGPTNDGNNSNQKQDSNNGNSVGNIAAAVGATIAAMLLIFGILKVYKRCKKKQSSKVTPEFQIEQGPVVTSAAPKSTFTHNPRRYKPYRL